MSAPMVQWMCTELSKLMDIDASEDIARYILAIETRHDLEEYMLELLDGSEPLNRKFINDLLIKWRPPATEDDFQVYHKRQDEENCYTQGKGKTKKKKSNKSMGKTNEQPNSNGMKDNQEVDDKKKQKFVPLYSSEGEARTTIKLTGRHSCECQASKHKLVNNCLKCGRVVCGQEGSGPCFFCGTLVCTNEEQEVLSRGTKKSDRMRQQLMKLQRDDLPDLPHVASRVNNGLQKAVEHKERLLDYDKSCARRTQVIDDESDYFSTDGNQWLTKEERSKLRNREEELREKRHGSRLDRKITFDFAGRRVVDEEMENIVNMYNSNDSVVQEVTFGVKDKTTENRPVLDLTEFSDLVNPALSYTKQTAPKFVTPEQKYSAKVSGTLSQPDVKLTKTLRLQDTSLQEMADDGVCLSMHQPWASLLVAGIKKHEGRSWYAAQRGRLYIAATAKVPTQEDIDELEDFYRKYYKKPRLRFPENYPSGCLLGCVELGDCLVQEEYREKFPNGESSSPFVFICDNPHELVVKFPIKGKHKIYHLDGNIHQAAKKGLRRVVIDV